MLKYLYSHNYITIIIYVYCSLQNMSKVVDGVWKAFGKLIQTDLPKLTALTNRKLAVSTHRDRNPERAHQEAPAAHMAHNVTTADKYYNRASRKETREMAV